MKPIYLTETDNLQFGASARVVSQRLEFFLLCGFARLQTNIGIAGLGVVAQGFLDLVAANREDLRELTGVDLRVARIASRRRRDDVDLQGISFSTDLDDLTSDRGLDIVIELIGGTDAAYDLIKACLENGLGVITANKAVLATHGNELQAIASRQNVPLAFEAAVAGGIPIIAALKTGFPANDVKWLAGIINGTCNYILTAMAQHDTAFADALKRAQELGFAEADPSFDVGGMDAAQKLSILLGLAFDIPISIDDVYCEGITEITIDDIQHAAELGYVIKHLAIGRRAGDAVEMRVHPVLVSHHNLLAKVDGVENAVQVGTASAGVLRFMGPGAGGIATASSVIADLANITSGLYKPRRIGAGCLKVKSIEDISSGFFLGISAADRPGVIARIGETLARHSISIASMIQKKEELVQTLDTAVIPIIILTNTIVERDLNDALRELESLEDITAPIKKIRVVDFA